MASSIKPDTALRYPLDQDFARIRMWQSSSSAPELQLALELHFRPEGIATYDPDSGSPCKANSIPVALAYRDVAMEL